MGQCSLMLHVVQFFLMLNFLLAIVVEGYTKVRQEIDGEALSEAELGGLRGGGVATMPCLFSVAQPCARLAAHS